MRNYVFTYYCDEGSGFKSHEFHVRADGFSRAFRFFRDFFNALVVCGDIKDYSVSYKIISSTNYIYRSIPSKLLSSLHNFVPEV